MAIIQGRHLMHSELLIVRLVFEGSNYLRATSNWRNMVLYGQDHGGVGGGNLVIGQCSRNLTSQKKCYNFQMALIGGWWGLDEWRGSIPATSPWLKIPPDFGLPPTGWFAVTKTTVTCWNWYNLCYEQYLKIFGVLCMQMEINPPTFQFVSTPLGLGAQGQDILLPAAV